MRRASRRNLIYGALAAVLTGAISFGILYAGYSAFQQKMTPMLLISSPPAESKPGREP